VFHGDWSGGGSIRDALCFYFVDGVGMNLRTAAQQALEALEFESSGYCGGEQTERALTALRERLKEST
jgi:hypothetical protein